MSVSAFTKKMPYLDIEDTLEEVGITRRQLNYWIEKELFTPELGGDAKKFTARDIKLLKFARRLIVDQQFPVEVAKRLIEAATSASSGWQEADLDDFQYLDVKSGILLSKKTLESILWREFGATATELEVENRLYDLTLLLYRLVRSSRPNPAVYEERRSEILNATAAWETAARLTWGPTYDEPSPHIHIKPQLYGDTTDLDEGATWLLEAHDRLQTFEAAESIKSGDWEEWQRFYTEDEVNGARKSLEIPLSMQSIPWDDSEPPF